MKRFHRRLLVSLLLLAGVCIALVAVDSGRRYGPLWVKYQKLQLGMTKEQVEEILGPPQSEEGFGGGFSGTLFCDWHEGDQSVMLRFEWNWSNAYQLHEKQFYPLTQREKVVRGVGDLLDPLLGRRGRSLP
jgi:hypothetical protein